MLASPKATGALLAEARDRCGWTQPEFGEMLGVSRSTVARWEAGKPLSLIQLAAICDALGVDPCDIICDGGQSAD